MSSFPTADERVEVAGPELATMITAYKMWTREAFDQHINGTSHVDEQYK